MPIGKALLLKGLGGLAALGGAIGVGYSIRGYFNKEEINETKFDRGLIDFLNEGGDILFSVKSNDSDVSDATLQTFSNTSLAVTIKVSVNTAESSNEGTLTEKSDAKEGSKAKKTYLQNLNKSNSGDGGTAWTWECKLEFKKVGDTNGATSLKDEYKKKIFDSGTPKGLLNKLKESGNKKQKIKFIQDCADARGKDKNKKIDELTSLSVTDGAITTANKIESTKEFELIKDNTNLIPKDKSDFDHWFKNVNN